MKRKYLVSYWLLLFAFGVANFASFLAITSLAGGDADHVEDGRYFLWTRHAPEPGGRTTEVSRLTYLWVLWQGRSLWVTQPLALLAAYFVLREHERRRKDRSDESRSSEFPVDNR